MKKESRKSRPIVIGHLEKVSSTVFDQYRKQITGMIKGNYGVYALYRRSKLYYIGLATDFRKRINQHLKDKHKGKWNYFSLYLIRKIDHLREVEALLVRIAEPGGNKQKGKLKRSKNLRPQLKRLLTEDTKRVIEEILGGETKQKKKRKKLTGRAKAVNRPLKGLLRNYQRIYANYKGKEFKAKVLPSGSVKFNDKIYDSPSGAAKNIIERGAVNGWNFWKYKDKSGNLVPLKKLRK